MSQSYELIEKIDVKKEQIILTFQEILKKIFKDVPEFPELMDFENKGQSEEEIAILKEKMKEEFEADMAKRLKSQEEELRSLIKEEKASAVLMMDASI